MTFLIVTGLSGSGKSSCIKVLEDIGFFCIDNMPPQLIPHFAELCARSGEEDEKLEKVAIVTDIRGGAMFLRLSENISKLRSIDGAEVRILYLDCAKDVLMKRYSETRRKHPLDEASGGNLSNAIDAENTLLADIRANSDYIIDSSLLTARPSDRMIISCMSFGFMYGVPGEADLVFDVRCLPNPFYIPELKKLTGTDAKVRDYVMSFPQSEELEKKLYDLVDFLAPLYVGEGKSRLVIAFGCTGGRHRSVTFAERAAKHFEEQGFRVRLNHRDKDK